MAMRRTLTPCLCGATTAASAAGLRSTPSTLRSRPGRRACSTPAGASADAGASEAEYWKTAAHMYQERLQVMRQFSGQCARMSPGFADAAKGWEHWEMPRRTAESLPYAEFFESFSKAARPVVIDGLSPAPQEWGELAYWKEQLGDTGVPSNVFSLSAPRGLLHHDTVPFSTFAEEKARRSAYPKGTLDDWVAPTPSSPGPLQSVEFDVPGVAPWALESFVVPKYFAQDLLQFAHQNTELRRSQVTHRDELEATDPRAALPALYVGDDLHIINGNPTVRIAPRGSQTALHHTPFSRHTWLHVTAGTLEVMMFPPDFQPALYEEEFCTYALDAFEPDFEAFPTAIMAYPWKLQLGVGETLFIPADSPFQLRSLEDTITVRSEFVDWGNAEACVYDAERLAECGNPAFKELTRGFNLGFLSLPQCAQTHEPMDTPYGAFLTWRNDSVPTTPDADTAQQ